MTKCRKALSLLLTILMVFSLFPMMVSADETGTGSTKPVWPEEGSIKLRGYEADQYPSSCKGVRSETSDKRQLNKDCHCYIC